MNNESLQLRWFWENVYQLLTKKNRIYLWGKAGFSTCVYLSYYRKQQGGDMVPKNETANAQTQWAYR